MFQPPSDNIIFLDTEFSSLDPYVGEVLSVGMVRMNGEELYFELEHTGEMSEWVQQHILSLLTEKKVSRTEAKEKINAFVGKDKPYMTAYVHQFDSIYLYKLLGTEASPFHWLPLDFASMLFALGYDPQSFDPDNKNNFFKAIGIDASRYRQHHALDDAKLLRDVYLALKNK